MNTLERQAAQAAIPLRRVDAEAPMAASGPGPSAARALLARTLMLLPLTAVCWATPVQDATPELNLETFDAVWTIVRDRHFDPELGGLDWEAVREEFRPDAEQARSVPELRGILNRMLQLLKQSHLAVIPGSPVPAGAERAPLDPPSEQVWDSGCGFAVALVDGAPRVASVQPGSAVSEAGVQAGWGIARVGDRPIPSACETTGAVNFPLLRATGSAVDVAFTNAAGDTLAVEIPLGARRSREYRFEGMSPIEVWIEHRRIDPDIGYIAFNWFFDPVLVSSQFDAAMTSFEDAAGVIIDVRGNSGGIGSLAASMISRFASEDEASLGTMVMRDRELRASTPRRAARFRGRVAVLIDGATGSAAEIFAAGMRDVGGARLFGQNTTGAVLPAAFERLPNGDSLLHVIANYVTADGVALEGSGVAPDQRTSLRRGADPLEDEALQSAIDWILGNG